LSLAQGVSDAFASRVNIFHPRFNKFHPQLNKDLRPSTTLSTSSGERVQSFHRDDGSFVTQYLFPSSTTVSRICWGRSSSTREMNQSVLARCDTLPNFSTAHGLLSPEVVMRIADLNDNVELNGALHNFLKTYKSRGPMSCLSMLSDPNILQELTKAMRDAI